MIFSVSANDPRFRTVEFKPSFNVVLAERTKESSEKDSRNGLGKSLLVEIIHFCLGSDPDPDDVLRQEPLDGWAFDLELEIRERRILVRRQTDVPRKIFVYGNLSGWPLQPRIDKETGEPAFSREDWCRLLGWAMFGLSTETGEKYVPSFRSLISYIIRRDQGGYLDPFKHHPRQAEWDKQVNVAFLLGLNWEHAQRWQLLKDRENELRQLSKTLKTGVASEFLGSIGTLDSTRVRLQRELAKEEAELREFNVHPQYRDIESEANQLTFSIRDLRNANAVDQGMLELYEQSIQQEEAADDLAVETIFAEAGVVLSGQVVRRLEDVREFHLQVTRNRLSYLEGEMGRLRASISARDTQIGLQVARRADLMDTLRTHGALDEYYRLQRLHSGKASELAELERRIDLWRNVERNQSAVKIEREGLRLDARADLEERRAEREEAIAFFNNSSEALYDAPGELVIDLTDSGFQFDVKIQRSGSEGINRMKVFCFDMMLAQRWSKLLWSPGFVIHDSILFDGVDERQRALAFQVASKEADARGFQYICCLNSDMVPWPEFGESFDFNSHVRHRLTDAREDGSLLGMRF